MKKNTEQTSNEFAPVCFVCGKSLIWQNDFMRSKMCLCTDDADEKDDAVVSVYLCPHCHITYEVQFPTENELEGYRLYEKNKKE